MAGGPRLLELDLDVAAGEEPGHPDAAAEELVADRHEARAEPVHHDAIEQRAHPRREHLAGDDGHVPRARQAGGPAAHRAGEGVLEAAHEADAVFGHREALVLPRPGQREARLQIKLVGGPDEARAERVAELALPALDGAHEGARLLHRDRAQIGEPLAVAREPDRHHRGGRHRGMEPGQLVHGAVEVRAVVPARAQHDLRVHGDARLGEPLHHRQQLAAHPWPAEQGVAQLRVGGVHRDVERREALGLDARELRFLEIGEGDVVAVQEREPEVVVLDVQALAHALRELVDEAEDALVGAGRDLGRARGLELEPELRAAAAEPRGARPPVALDREAQVLLARVEVEVDHVAQGRAVDREDAVPGTQARPGRGRPRRHRGHHDALCGLGRPAGHGQTRPLTEVGVSSCLSPRMMYCSPEVIVNAAVTQASSVVTNAGRSWK